MGVNTAVILAAGRGSRMKSLTNERPKCLLELAGHSLLEWQLKALKAAGIKRIIVVCGYLGVKIKGDFEKVDNTRWAETNMVRSLECIFPHLNQEESIIVSYADIVYKEEHVQTLINTKGEICITYDTSWENLWRLRQDNPLIDAETFKQQNGVLLDIGEKPNSLDDIQGQYMGLLKITPNGIAWISNYTRKLPSEKVDKLDMTSLLRGLLNNHKEIKVCPVNGGWCECDTAEDIKRYELQLSHNDWLHDWR